MRRDYRPYWMRQTFARYEEWWARHFLHPQFERIGEAAHIKKPWNVELVGAGISAGKHLHVICEKRTTTRFSTWSTRSEGGRITLGDFVLVSPGVQVLSAARIDIGSNVMMAGHAILSDCDWHGLLDRTQEPEARPITLKENSWIGYGAYVGKGVTVGENSVVGARSVVIDDVPDNTVVAGNPARPIKELDGQSEFVRREAMFEDAAAEKAKEDYLYKLVLEGNTTAGWARRKFFPSRND